MTMFSLQCLTFYKPFIYQKKKKVFLFKQLLATSTTVFQNTQILSELKHDIEQETLGLSLEEKES